LNIKKSIILNLRWHRRIGLSLFFMVIFLALSGFALNHSVGLKLSNSKLSSDWLLSWYGLEPAANHGFELNAGNWLYQADDSKLFLGNQVIAQCKPPLLSVAEFEQQILALCDDALIMLTAQGQLIEKFTRLQGLPEDISSITVHNNTVYLHGISDVFAFDADRLTVTPTSIIVPSSNTAPRPLPRALKEYLKVQGLSSSISMETLILDLHSGRFFGDAGVLFIDIVGLLLCILAITGLWAWVDHQRYRKDQG
jgi:hypothetical protein